MEARDRLVALLRELPDLRPGRPHGPELPGLEALLEELLPAVEVPLGEGALGELCHVGGLRLAPTWATRFSATWTSPVSRSVTATEPRATGLVAIPGSSSSSAVRTSSPSLIRPAPPPPSSSPGRSAPPVSPGRLHRSRMRPVRTRTPGPARTRRTETMMMGPWMRFMAGTPLRSFPPRSRSHRVRRRPGRAPGRTPPSSTAGGPGRSPPAPGGPSPAS